MNDMAPIREAIATKKQPVTFTPKWWYDLRKLDARPIIWSLKNKPHDWKLDSPYPFTIMHIPSKHEFWIAHGQFHLYYADNCGCHSRRSSENRFQTGQYFQLRWALMKWKRQMRMHEKALEIRNQTNAKKHKHFQEHFTLGIK